MLSPRMLAYLERDLADPTPPAKRSLLSTADSLDALWPHGALACWAAAAAVWSGVLSDLGLQTRPLSGRRAALTSTLSSGARR